MSADLTHMEEVSLSEGKLWGRAGGLLEYVGQRMEVRRDSDGTWYPVIVLMFTDHDSWGTRPEIEPGVHYRLELPIAEYIVRD